jgi:hypothetical protein
VTGEGESLYCSFPLWEPSSCASLHLFAILGLNSNSDFVFLVVARRSFQRDGISIGLILEGVLGGFPAFNGVVHAYVILARQLLQLSPPFQICL